ncbi:unnamed protein product [Schistosoma turkestanicum]|nr:unnamed protein product [Schistosoma turkestanicum]
MSTSADCENATNNNDLNHDDNQLTSAMNINDQANLQNQEEQQKSSHGERQQQQERRTVQHHKFIGYIPTTNPKCSRYHMVEKERNVDTSDSCKHSCKNSNALNRLSTSSVTATTEKTTGNVNRSVGSTKFLKPKNSAEHICSLKNNMDQSRLSDCVSENGDSVNCFTDNLKRASKKHILVPLKQINKQDSNKTFDTPRPHSAAQSHQNQSQIPVLSTSQRQYSMKVPASSTSFSVSNRLSNTNQRQSSTSTSRPHISHSSSSKAILNRHSLIKQRATLQTAYLYVSTMEICCSDTSSTIGHFLEVVPINAVELEIKTVSNSFSSIVKYKPFTFMQHVKLYLMNNCPLNYLPIHQIVSEDEIKSLVVPSFQNDDHLSITAVQSFTGEIQSNVHSQTDLDKRCLKKKHSSVVSRTPADLSASVTCSSVSPSLSSPSSSSSSSSSSSALVLMDPNHQQLATESYIATPTDHSIDNGDIISTILVGGNDLSELLSAEIIQIQSDSNLTISTQNVSERRVVPVRTTIIRDFVNSSNCIPVTEASYKSHKMKIKNVQNISYQRTDHLNDEVLINSPLNTMSTTLNKVICKVNHTKKHDDDDDDNGANHVDGAGDYDDKDNCDNSSHHITYSQMIEIQNGCIDCKLFVERLSRNTLIFIYNNVNDNNSNYSSSNDEHLLYPAYSLPATPMFPPLPLPGPDVPDFNNQNTNYLYRTTSYLFRCLSNASFTKYSSYFLFLCTVLYWLRASR